MSTFEEDAGRHLASVDHDKSDDWVAGFIAAITWARSHDAKVRAEALREFARGINLDAVADEWSDTDAEHWSAGNAASSVQIMAYDRADRIEREAGL